MPAKKNRTQKLKKDDYYTTAEALKASSLSRSTLFRRMRDGVLNPIRVNDRIYYWKKTEVDALNPFAAA